MGVNTELIKELRQLTSLGVMECKRALEQAGGDFEKAKALLAERAAEKANEKSEREVKQGIIDAYIHGDGRIGVLLEVLCETDFLARSETFRRLVKDIALQIASMNPQYISANEVPAEVIHQVECEAEGMARAQGKPEKVIEQIKAGKVRKFMSEVCLLEQRFIKDDNTTVGDLIRTFVGQSGENVQIRYFVRRQLDE
jgi:elongation factor Ts